MVEQKPLGGHDSIEGRIDPVAPPGAARMGATAGKVCRGESVGERGIRCRMGERLVAMGVEKEECKTNGRGRYEYVRALALNLDAPPAAHFKSFFSLFIFSVTLR